MADQAAKANLAMREIVRDASLLREKRKELEALRLEDVRDWQQNREFYKNNQWVFWNREAGRIETLGVEDNDKPRYKVRLTVNQITPGVESLVAQMTKTRPVIRARPNSGSDRDVKAAEMAERLYEHWWGEFGLGAKLKSALTHAQISQGYWLITWDPLAGSAMRLMVNPETGEVIMDDDVADAFRSVIQEQAQAEGLNPADVLGMFEKTLLMGDIKVQPLDGHQVWIDPIATNFDDARWAIVRVPMDVDDIEARWKERVQPTSSTGEQEPALAYTRRREERPKTAREVYFLFHRPGPTMPRGRVVVWIEGPDKILHQGDWDLPFTTLPLVKFPGIERPGSALDIPRTTLARPLQKELNLRVSRIAEHMNLTMRPQMVAPVNSLTQRLTDEPGAVWQFNPVQGIIPEWRPVPSLPGHAFAYIEQIQARIDRLYNQMPSERSQLPARTDSGQLVELVQEAVADQIAPEIHRMEDALARAGNIMAAYAQKYYIEPRHLKIIGPGGSVQVEKFLNADLTGGFSFEAEAGSGLPRTRAGRIQQLREMVEMGVAQPHEILPYLPVAGLKTIQTRLQADEDFANRKIQKLLRGEPLNVPAMLQALAQVETGINPQTGELFEAPEEAMAFVEAASLSPAPYENLATTMFVLSNHMKSAGFEKYAPEIQQRFQQHFSMLQDAMLAQPVMTDPVKTTLSLKGTLGPTVAAEILQQKGIRGANPMTMAEPPLETSVYDSMDKPDADEAGNDPLTQQEQLLAMSREEDKHQVAMAKGLADAHLAQKRAAEADEIHEQRMRHSEESHRERIRQARQPKPTGASSGG